MNDSDIEDLLRKYRPVGPPPRLRARILSAQNAPRVWPWASAAAALLASALALHFAVRHETAAADPRMATDPAVHVVENLTDMFGGDAAARRMAEFVLLQQQVRSEGAGPAVQPDAIPAGDVR